MFRLLKRASNWVRATRIYRGLPVALPAVVFSYVYEMRHAGHDWPDLWAFEPLVLAAILCLAAAWIAGSCLAAFRCRDGGGP